MNSLTRRSALTVSLLAAPLLALAGGVQVAPPPEEVEEAPPAPSYGNQDLERYAAERPRDAPSQESSESLDTPEPRGANAEESSSSSDAESGEAYWRGRADAARAAIRRAEADLERAEAARAARGSGAGRDPMRQPKQSDALEQDPYRVLTAGDDVGSLEDAVKRAEAELESARAVQVELQTEARQAGALPGWLRER